MLASLYSPLVKRAPSVYATFYHATNTPLTNLAMAKCVQSLLKEGLTTLFRRLRPDVVVAIHPVLIKPSLAIMEDMGLRIPVLTVVTDLVRFHRSWAIPEVDACSVPTRAAYDYVVGLGMPHSKIRLLGMPIHPRF